MRDYDDKTIERNIAEANEINRAGQIPTHGDIRWTGAEKLRRERDLKQFCKSSGESGSDPYFKASDAYREGWIRVFGTPEEKASLNDPR
jgi:hypothetical protein